MLVLPREECLRLLASHRFGRLAVAMDTPVIRPVNYVFDDRSQSVVFRTADGSKFHAMLIHGNAAFEIDGVDPELAHRLERDHRRHDRAGHEPRPTPTPRPPRTRDVDARHKAHWMRIRAWTVSGRRIVLSGAPCPLGPSLTDD